MAIRGERACLRPFGHFWGQVVFSSSSVDEQGPVKTSSPFGRTRRVNQNGLPVGVLPSPSPRPGPGTLPRPWSGAQPHSDFVARVRGRRPRRSLPSSAPWLARAVSATYCIVDWRVGGLGSLRFSNECRWRVSLAVLRTSLAVVGAARRFAVNECRRCGTLTIAPKSICLFVRPPEVCFARCTTMRRKRLLRRESRAYAHARPLLLPPPTPTDAEQSPLGQPRLIGGNALQFSRPKRVSNEK